MFQVPRMAPSLQLQQLKSLKILFLVLSSLPMQNLNIQSESKKELRIGQSFLHLETEASPPSESIPTKSEVEGLATTSQASVKNIISAFEGSRSKGVRDQAIP